MNKREEIRKHVAEKLKGQGIAYGNVYASRTIPITETELPVVIIAIESESSWIVTRGTHMSEKTAQVIIEVAVDGTTLNPDISLDRITGEIERCLVLDHTLGNLVNRSELKSTEIVLMREGELPIGMARMRYEMTYFSGVLEEVEGV